MSAVPGTDGRDPVRAAGRAPHDRPRIAIGSDHGGFALKTRLLEELREELRLPAHDCGCYDRAPVDYPDIAFAVGREVAGGRADLGIMIDAAGIGSTMALNKLDGIRAALCHDAYTTRNSRAHNDANVLVLGAQVLHPGEAVRLLKIWLRTSFEGGRHAPRVDKIVRPG